MELSLAEALERGIAAHREGKLQDAERFYRAILNAQPEHPDANHNLGVLAVAVGKVSDALPLFKQALETNPQVDQFWLSYIDALIKSERFEEAAQTLSDRSQSGISSETLDSLKKALQVAVGQASKNDNKRLPLAEKRKKFAEKKRKKRTKAQPSVKDEAPSQDEMATVLADFQAGRVDVAERLARALTEQFPKHQFGWKALGVFLYHTGSLKESLEALRRAVALAPKDPEIHFNLGVTLQGLGELRDAEFSFREALKLNPSLAVAHNNLANTLAQSDRLNEAEESYRTATEYDSSYAEAYNNLGNIQKKLKRLDEARFSYGRAIACNPSLAEPHFNLGVMAQQLGDFDGAEQSYRKAIQCDAAYAAAYSNLGNVFKERGAFEKAKANYETAIRCDPSFAGAHFNLGVLLEELLRFDEAAQCYHKAISADPELVSAHNNVGVLLTEKGCFKEAEISFRRALESDSNHPKAHYGLGVLLQKMGRLSEAESCYQKAVTVDPCFAKAHNNLGTTLQALGRIKAAQVSYEQAIFHDGDYAEAHRNLTTIKKFDLRDAQYLAMLRLHAKQSLPVSHRSHICFALAKAADDLADYASAFKFYAEGNQCRRLELNYDRTRESKVFGRLKSSYPSLRDVAIQEDTAEQHLIPIFIVGMPRSGTTLVEQIVSSHSEVTGAGELIYASEYGSRLASGLTQPTIKSIRHFRAKYLDSLRERSLGRPYVTDKLPQNFLLLGLLSCALPEAKFIHVKRDPAAVCWGNYTKYFEGKGLRYCYDLHDTLHYFTLYQDLMSYWHRNVRQEIITLEYEALTANQENQISELIDRLGLQWESACLAPHNNDRSVESASNSQIRRPIYQGSSGRWKNYRPYLNGVLDEFPIINQ